MIGNKQNNFHGFLQKAMNSVFLVRYLTAVVRICFFFKRNNVVFISKSAGYSLHFICALHFYLKRRKGGVVGLKKLKINETSQHHYINTPFSILPIKSGKLVPFFCNDVFIPSGGTISFFSYVKDNWRCVEITISHPTQNEIA